jgi:hypothetical protein
MKGERLVMEVMVGFLNGKAIGSPPPLQSINGMLLSYGTPIARWNSDRTGIEVVDKGKVELRTVSKKHLNWLMLLAKEKGIEVSEIEGDM